MHGTFNHFSASGPAYNATLVKATFLVIVGHCELIFCLLTSPKRDFDKVEKAIIQVFECHFDVIICFLNNRKSDFYHVDKATIQVVELHLKVIFCLLTSPKFELLK